VFLLANSCKTVPKQLSKFGGWHRPFSFMRVDLPSTLRFENMGCQTIELKTRQMTKEETIEMRRAVLWKIIQSSAGFPFTIRSLVESSQMSAVTVSSDIRFFYGSDKIEKVSRGKWRENCPIPTKPEAPPITEDQRNEVERQYHDFKRELAIAPPPKLGWKCRGD
jgi:hypothetical protein